MRMRWLRPFLRGMGSILELFPRPRSRRVPRIARSDAEALRSDWDALCRDGERLWGSKQKGEKSEP